MLNSLYWRGGNTRLHTHLAHCEVKSAKSLTHTAIFSAFPIWSGYRAALFPSYRGCLADGSAASETHPHNPCFVSRSAVPCYRALVRHSTLDWEFAKAVWPSVRAVWDTWGRDVLTGTPPRQSVCERFLCSLVQFLQLITHEWCKKKKLNACKNQGFR